MRGNFDQDQNNWQLLLKHESFECLPACLKHEEEESFNYDICTLFLQLMIFIINERLLWCLSNPFI
jgi:hypothetical protein